MNAKHIMAVFGLAALVTTGCSSLTEHSKPAGFKLPAAPGLPLPADTRMRCPGDEKCHSLPVPPDPIGPVTGEELKSQRPERPKPPAPFPLPCPYGPCD
jgi:hypothetical protein